MQSLIENSPPGMAHWSGTGPRDKTCRECTRWLARGYSKEGAILDAPCAKYKDMTGRAGARVPARTTSCQFFDQSPNPPAISTNNS